MEKEQWFETVERVVTGTYTMQKTWIENHRLGWDEEMAQRSAQEMYNRIYNFKFLPPGRGLWSMGSNLTLKKHLYASLNNCAFVSTSEMVDNPVKPFIFMMDSLMLGVGVGFDTEGAGKVMIKKIDHTLETETYVIPDTREGWVVSLEKLLNAYFVNGKKVEFDYSLIRGKGLPIKGFGGISSGPDPLINLHSQISEIFDRMADQAITIRNIVDVMNLISVCVIAGNVHRSSQICFGYPESNEFLDLKDYQKNPDRAMHGWSSNNSIFANLGMDYTKVCERITNNGEPGIAWLKNMQEYGRMNGTKDYKDHRAKGGNPCLEQTLEPYELCCLVETFPNNHDDLQDYLRTLKFAYLYAKTVTLGKTHWPETNRVLLRNRRIGCSMSGIAQFVSNNGLPVLKEWMEKGYGIIQEYDKTYSDWFAIPRSIKTTSIKPSGSVSLLAGATPGIHYPESNYYIRRVRVAKNSNLLKPLIEAGYHVEPSVTESEVMVVEFPIKIGDKIRTVADVSMWEQLNMASFAQRYWADNQVSCTVTFDPFTEGSQIKQALNIYQYQLKGISFLPKITNKSYYKQLPYETITKETYEKMIENITEINFSKKGIMEDMEIEKFCDGDSCQI
ncbi:vitamin b12-dependent ribonucleotide reductase [Anaeramoeba flamelloides]|uniref:ribonucleoside-triphosphate reductase (thioredoxin) n=1 Tax=Anaeramoeba flamelloides TaxID=1746091 RepID=A0AAV7ZUD3_9EUKA|nr:vitamin b12-dependent ribonucleotide reductase [Anaeramoeba flamelloides]